MDEGEILWVDDGTGDPAGYAKINGAVVRIGTNLDINLSTLNTTGDYFGIAQSNVLLGENVAAFNALYLKSDGKYWKANANAQATTPCSVLSLGAGSALGTIKGLVLGYVYNSGWLWTVGDTNQIYLSNLTAGALTQTIPITATHEVQVVALPKSATMIYFNPMYSITEIIP
jgi:hypothetical protein